MRKVGPITGTFIDEITYDIPSSNWSLDEWRADLDNMKKIGMDTLVFIRGGFGEKTIYPSKYFGTTYADDFAGFILEEAAKRDMQVFMGLYISDIDWHKGDAKTEIQKNKFFLDEVMQRYKDMPAFKGWYIPHETAYDTLNICDVMGGLSAMCKDKAPEKQVLISPFLRSRITYPEAPFTPAEHYEEWDRIFSKCGKDIDICAFQDGTAPLAEMDDYFGYTKKLCDKHNIRHWINAEGFERDPRCVYFPIPFSVLKQRLEHHKNYAEKVITFEFSHFLSPQSIYPSARNLHRLYTDYYLK